MPATGCLLSPTREFNCTRRWPLSPAVNPANGNLVEKRSEVVDPATQALLDMVDGLETPKCTLSTSL